MAGKIKKQDIYNWIESKRMEAIEKANDDEKSEMDVHNGKLYAQMDLEETASEIQSLFSKIDDIHQNWAKKAELVDDVVFKSYWSCIHRDLYKYIERPESTLDHMRTSLIDETKEYLAISKKYNDIRTQIDENFNNLTKQVKGYHSMEKEILPFLKNCGFDISKIPTNEPLALSVPIDFRYLFYGADDVA